MVHLTDVMVHAVTCSLCSCSFTIMWCHGHSLRQNPLMQSTSTTALIIGFLTCNSVNDKECSEAVATVFFLFFRITNAYASFREVDKMAFCV